MRFLEMCNIVEGFLPVDLQTAANTGDWVSLKNYGHVAIVFISAIGTAGDDPTLTVLQASAVAGTGSKALAFTDIFTKQAATSLASIAGWTRVTQAAANTYTHTDAAEQDLIWVVEIDADTLDVDGGFDCVSASVADVGGNAQLGYLFYILSQPRYPQAAATMLSPIID